jgi:hypothetical protein
MPTRWGEGQRRHIFAERKVIEDDSPRDIGEDRATVFVDWEE